jgi:hypothetical protein
MTPMKRPLGGSDGRFIGHSYTVGPGVTVIAASIGDSDGTAGEEVQRPPVLIGSGARAVC